VYVCVRVLTGVSQTITAGHTQTCTLAYRDIATAARSLDSKQKTSPRWLTIKPAERHC